MSTLNEFDQPKEISDTDIAFGCVKGLMPKYDDIPAKFNCYTGEQSWANQLFMDWFYCGLKSLSLQPREGINKDKALRHIKTIMSSFEPKHEHKVATCAFLLDKWFESGKWERKEIAWAKRPTTPRDI